VMVMANVEEILNVTSLTQTTILSKTATRTTTLVSHRHLLGG